jgi:hypothetical protein
MSRMRAVALADAPRVGKRWMSSHDPDLGQWSERRDCKPHVFRAYGLLFGKVRILPNPQLGESLVARAEAP